MHGKGLRELRTEELKRRQFGIGMWLHFNEKHLKRICIYPKHLTKHEQLNVIY